MTSERWSERDVTSVGQSVTKSIMAVRVLLSRIRLSLLAWVSYRHPSRYLSPSESLCLGLLADGAGELVEQHGHDHVEHDLLFYIYI